MEVQSLRVTGEVTQTLLSTIKIRLHLLLCVLRHIESVSMFIQLFRPAPRGWPILAVRLTGVGAVAVFLWGQWLWRKKDRKEDLKAKNRLNQRSHIWPHDNCLCSNTWSTKFVVTGHKVRVNQSKNWLLSIKLQHVSYKGRYALQQHLHSFILIYCKVQHQILKGCKIVFSTNHLAQL